MPTQLTFLLDGRPRQDLLDHLKNHNLEYVGDFTISWRPTYGIANVTPAGQLKHPDWLIAQLAWQ